MNPTEALRDAAYWYERTKQADTMPAEAGAHYNNLYVARSILWVTRRYSTAVEDELDGGLPVLQKVVPQQEDDLLFAWVPYWYDQEKNGHAQWQLVQAKELGIQTLPSKDSKINPVHSIIGFAAERSKHVQPIARLGAVGVIALGENETYPVYNWETRQLRETGENDAARASSVTASQEVLHLNFLHNYGMELADTMPKRYVDIAGRAVEYFFEPVGVQTGDRLRACGFGHILRVATDDNGQEVAHKVITMLHSIFPGISVNNPFIENKYQECVDLSSKSYPGLVDDYQELKQMALTLAA